MQRAIVTPTDLAGTALGELKDWLAITSMREDTSLIALLAASVETCEAFTRKSPLVTEYEEILAPLPHWQPLSTQPVQAITGVFWMDSEGFRSPLAVDDYLVDIQFNGTGRIRLVSPRDEGRLIVRFTAGIAEDWDHLPSGLRHGIVRLAAHHFRQRDDAESAHPPAAITALWRPWREMRLA